MKCPIPANRLVTITDNDNELNIDQEHWKYLLILPHFWLLGAVRWHEVYMLFYPCPEESSQDSALWDVCACGLCSLILFGKSKSEINLMVEPESTSRMSLLHFHPLLPLVIHWASLSSLQKKIGNMHESCDGDTYLSAVLNTNTPTNTFSPFPSAFGYQQPWQGPYPGTWEGMGVDLT